VPPAGPGAVTIIVFLYGVYSCFAMAIGAPFARFWISAT
jgi:hypothetical protein